MSIVSSLTASIRGFITKMIGANTLKNAIKVTPAISPIMEQSIQLWSSMYQDQAPWLKGATLDDPTVVVSMGIPATIAGEKARVALVDFKSEVTAPSVANITADEITGEQKTELKYTTNPKRAEILNKSYEVLKGAIREQLEYGIAKGGVIIKPYPVDTEPNQDNSRPVFCFDYIGADNFYPIAYNNAKEITEAIFIQPYYSGRYVYRRLEHHKYENGSVIITNRAFRADIAYGEDGSSGSASLNLGLPCPLSEVAEWADIAEEVKIDGVKGCLFAYFKMPEVNNKDLNSPLGASGFSRAIGLIEEADKQFSRLLWEYEGGEIAIDIDRDAMRPRMDDNGNEYTVRPMLQARLLRQVDLGDKGETYKAFAPTLRDASYISGLNTILTKIEDTCAISRGTLSVVTDIARTATELKILKQRTYQANADIQTALQKTLDKVLYVMDVYCDLYNLAGDITYDKAGEPLAKSKGEWSVSYNWDDSILTDTDTELTRRVTMQDKGLVSRIENRMWYFGEDYQTAKDAIQRIDEENAARSQMFMGKQDQNDKGENEDESIHKPTDAGQGESGDTQREGEVSKES